MPSSQAEPARPGLKRVTAALVMPARTLMAGLAAVLAAALAPPGAAAQGGRPPAIAECAACHGEEGIARDIEVPHLAGQNERYLYNQMVAFRNGRRQHREMRHMAREMTISEIEAIAAYYASLPPR